MHGKHLLKTLGLSMLVTVGVMAMSASVAQAKWKLRIDNKFYLSTFLDGTTDGGNLAVEGLGLDISCSGDEIGGLIAEESSVLKASASVRFALCEIVEFDGFCDVNSIGLIPGAIRFEGNGTGKMTGSKTFVVLESSKFTTIEISGEFCPFSEIDGKVSGSMTLTFLDAATEEVSHGIALDEVSLKFGEETAVLEGEGGGPVIGDAETAFGEPWAIWLTEL